MEYNSLKALLVLAKIVTNTQSVSNQQCLLIPKVVLTSKDLLNSQKGLTAKCLTKQTKPILLWPAKKLDITLLSSIIRHRARNNHRTLFRAQCERVESIQNWEWDINSLPISLVNSSKSSNNSSNNLNSRMEADLISVSALKFLIIIQLTLLLLQEELDSNRKRIQL